MNTVALHTSIIKNSKPWVYYGSLIVVLLLSLSSYFIADVAQGKTKQPIDTVSFYIIAQYSLMALFMLLAWYTSPNSSALKSYKFLILIAIIVRVVLIDITPYISNDVDRYLFDGRIAYEGYDPYQISHDNPNLSELRAIWQPPPEHAKYVTLYPPISLALFAFSSSFGVENAQQAWQLILLVASLLTVWITSLVLKKAQKLQHLVLVALSPLLILETGVGMHVDALSTLAIISAIYLWKNKKIAWCGAIIGLGVSIKVLPIMLLLPLFFIQKTIKGAATLVINCAITILLIYGVTYALGYYPVGSIGVFFEKWRSASPFFSLVDNVLSNTHIMMLILCILSIFASAIAYLCYTYGFTNNDQSNPAIEQKNKVIYACLQLSVALPLIVSPVLFPWYLLPLVPLLALWPNKYLISWMLIMPLTYEVIGPFLSGKGWHPAQWPVVLLGIFYLFTLTNAFVFIVKHFKQLGDNKKTVHASSN